MAAYPCWACDSSTEDRYQLEIRSTDHVTRVIVVVVCRGCIGTVEAVLLHRRCRPAGSLVPGQQPALLSDTGNVP